MKTIWIKGVLIIGVIVIVLMALHYRETSKEIPLSEIFPEEHTYPVDVEYVDEKSSVKSLDNQNLKSSSMPVVNQKASVSINPAQTSQAASIPEVKVVKPEVAVAMPSVDTNSVAKNPFFSIQVVSSKEKVKAEALMNKLKSKNNDVFIRSVDIKDKGTWHRVYVGQFLTKNEADQLLLNLKNEFPTAFVTSLKK